MKLSEYLNDRDVVVRLAGQQIKDLQAFETLRKSASKVEFATAQGVKFQEVVTSHLHDNGDFDLKDRIAVRTQIGLLTVSSVPGRNARSIRMSNPEADRPWSYRPGW